MKVSNLSKLIGAGVLAASIAVVPFMPASAQSDTNTTTGTTTGATTGQGVEDADYDNGFDWGWLGLLGLAGLGGLAGRKRHDDNVHYRREDEVRTTNYR